MPLYEYECETEGTRFEVIRKFSDPPLEICPTCGGPIRRLPSSPAIQFKGSGWYITDYAKKSSTEAGKDTKSAPSAKDSGKDSSSSSNSGGSSGGSSDTAKPATSSTSSTSSSDSKT